MMDAYLCDLLKLQGEIKIQALLCGVPEPAAQDLAAETLHKIATSNVCSVEHRAAYARIAAGEARVAPV